jgi:hypothetical protein
MWCGSWYNSDWRVGAKVADKTGMGTGRRLPSRLLGLCCRGAFEFRPIPNASTKSEIRKATCTESLLGNDERRPLLSENVVDGRNRTSSCQS